MEVLREVEKYMACAYSADERGSDNGPAWLLYNLWRLQG